MDDALDMAAATDGVHLRTHARNRAALGILLIDLEHGDGQGGRS